MERNGCHSLKPGARRGAATAIAGGVVHTRAAAAVRRLRPGALVGALLAAPPALGSFNGSIGPLPVEFVLIASALFAAPVAAVCAAIEWVGARRRPPVWIGIAALVLATFCLIAILGAFGMQRYGIAYLVAFPPLTTLALVALVPVPRMRVFAVWTVALGMAWAVARSGFGIGNDREGAALSVGGTLVLLPLWQLTYLLRQASLRRQGFVAPQPPDFRVLLQRLADTVRPAPRRVIDPPPLLATGERTIAAPAPDAHAGLRWWLAGAVGFHVGLTMLTAAGILMPAMVFAQAEWQVLNLFGLPELGPAYEGPTRRWVLHGLPWSVLAGCAVWGWGACAGMFDAGRLAPLRMAAAVLPLALFVLLLVTSRHGFL